MVFYYRKSIKIVMYITGIFLGDAGWLIESSEVLGHTFNIMNTKWKCLDKNLKLLKSLQCLTKLVEVLTQKLFTFK